MEQNKDAPVLNKTNIEHFLGALLRPSPTRLFHLSDFPKEWYKPNPTDKRMSPLLLEDHKGLPPAYLQISGLDPLRDDGLIYEKVLREAGVPTKLEVYVLSISFLRS